MEILFKLDLKPFVKISSCLIISIMMYFSLGYEVVNAQELVDEGILHFGKDNSSQYHEATSTDPTNDNRVASLWKMPSNNSKPIKFCTANYLGNKFWVTAKHCVHDSLESDWILRQSDEEIAGVESIHEISGNHDIAMLKAGDGIDADNFLVSKKKVTLGSDLALLGYSAKNDFPSLARVRVNRFRESVQVNGYTFDEVIESISVGKSRTCDGDSGAGLFIENDIYAIHTAGISNPDCSDLKGSKMIHTPLTPHLDWINSTMQYRSSSAEHKRGENALQKFRNS